MAYAIIQDLTGYGIELMQSNPTVANNLVIQADAHTKLVTDNNYGIGSTFLDVDFGLAWYDIAPLTVSAQMEMQQASLGFPSAGLLDTLKAIGSYAITIGSGIIAGAIIGGLAGTVVPVVGPFVGAFIGALAGAVSAVIGKSISAYNYDTAQVEVAQSAQDNYETLLKLFAEGKITQEQFENALKAIQEAREGGEDVDGIPWTTIIIAGMIGVGALAALYIFMKTK